MNIVINMYGTEYWDQNVRNWIVFSKHRELNTVTKMYKLIIGLKCAEEISVLKCAELNRVHKMYENE